MSAEEMMVHKADGKRTQRCTAKAIHGIINKALLWRNTQTEGKYGDRLKNSEKRNGKFTQTEHEVTSSDSAAL